MSEEIFETYEREFNSLTAEVEAKIADAVPKAAGEAKKVLLNQTERDIDEAEEIIAQMEMELLSLPAAGRAKLQPRVKNYKAQLDKLKRDLKTTLSNAEREALLGGKGGRGDLDAEVAAQDQRTRLLAGTDRLNNASRRLEDAHRIAIETENVGVETLGTLQQQREQILRTRDTLSTADSFIASSQRVLKGMQRRMATNKLITAAIIIVLVAMILLIIWLRFF
ncbi:vesicle transport v-SNARE protein N-terminus-domain-containing protein [Hyaloraphidium curvatum]|nr:vesicle transport v-SNARE protein N-terminus-domain-containing protein [Hyaloraphidium curvatum]